MQTTSADDPRHFTCFLCQFVAPDRLQLRQHLSNRRKFPCFDWTPARDCLPDQVTCAHCGSVYHSLEVVRKHIIYGFCKQFNPDRPWTQNGNPVMVDQLRLGRVDLLLADADMRKALTLTCQFCSKQFSQACNLINHLVVQHAEICCRGRCFSTDLAETLCASWVLLYAPSPIREAGASMRDISSAEHDALQWEPTSHSSSLV